MLRYSPRAAWRRASAPATAVALGMMMAAGLLAACKGDPLSVESPSRIPAGGLESAANALLLTNGAVGDFECALGSYIVLGGLIGEELDDATQTADRYPYDQRTVLSSDRRYAVNGCEGLGVYSPLQTSRVSADNVRRLLEGLTDQQVANRPRLLATVDLVEGYSMLLLGEGFCSTTFSTFDASGNVVYAPEITRQQAFAAAEDRFTAAIAIGPAGSDSVLNAALVGRARSRLDQGNLAGARADAAQVPALFVYRATASATTGRRNNRIWVQNNTMPGPSTSVGVPYRNLNDPRVPVTDLKAKSVTGVPLFAQTKYVDSKSSFPIASGKEAQLIIAEADIAANSANSVLIINAFRAQGKEGPYVGLADAASLKNEVIDQRRRALFLEGQHLGDLIRYGIIATPAAGTAYPGGGQYGPGSNLCLPLPDVERQNNPLLRP